MSDSNSLQDTIDQYEIQLLQVQQALQDGPTGQSRTDLLSLESNIKELLQLTKESISNSNGATRSTDCVGKASRSMDDEYALFMAEMANLEESKDERETETNDANDEFKELEGSKCRAPYGSSYGGTTYHNAMICSILRDETIMAKVMFINPTHKEMLPCPYFLEGTCRFSEDLCHFSHGHVVPFENLKEYKEPDYSSIKVGSTVLAKAKNKLWHRAIVLDDSFRVKFESSGSILEMSLQDLFPLSNEDLNLSDSSDDSEEEPEDEKEIRDIYTEKFVHQSLLTANSNQPLGDWEKYTKGIGSKLMGKMGYVMGMGLGKEADGRVDPVEALVLPAGKSLDHCMALREIAGGDKDFFSAEKILKKQEKKLEEQRNRDYQRQKDAEKNNVFNFINTTLGDKPKDSQPSTSKVKKSLKTESIHKLNVESFKIGENINKLETESTKLKKALTRHSKGSIHYNNLVSQYNEKQKEIGKLRVSEKQIAAEQKERKVKSKLSIF